MKKIFLTLVLISICFALKSQTPIVSFQNGNETVCLYMHNGKLNKGIIDPKTKEITSVKEFPDKGFGKIYYPQAVNILTYYDGRFQFVYRQMLVDSDTLLNDVKVQRVKLKDIMKQQYWPPVDSISLQRFFPSANIDKVVKYEKFPVGNKVIYYDRRAGRMLIAKPVKPANKQFVEWEFINATKVDSSEMLLDHATYNISGNYFFIAHVKNRDNYKSRLFYITDNAPIKQLEVAVNNAIGLIHEIRVVNGKYFVFGNFASNDDFTMNITSMSKVYDGYFTAVYDDNENTLKHVNIVDLQGEPWYDSKFSYKAILSYFNSSTGHMMVSVNVGNEHNTTYNKVMVGGYNNAPRHKGVPFIFRKYMLDKDYTLKQEGEIQAMYTSSAYGKDTPALEPGQDVNGIIRRQGSVYYYPSRYMLTETKSVQNSITMRVDNPVTLIADDLNTFIYETHSAYYKVSGWDKPVITPLEFKFTSKNDLVNGYTVEYAYRNVTLYRYIDGKSYMKLQYDKSARVTKRQVLNY